MTESSKDQLNTETTELRQSTFSCEYCGSGSENLRDIFNEGKCRSCGGSAGVIVETSRPEDLQKIKQSILLIVPKDEADEAARITEDLLGEGINVINPEIVVENEQAGNRANVLAFLAENCKHVLVIPPKKGEFSEDRLVSAAVEGAMMSGKKNVVPLYPDASYKTRYSMLTTRAGVQWRGELGRGDFDKERFLRSFGEVNNPENS